MGDHILVLPFRRDLIARLRTQALVVHTSDPDLIAVAAAEVEARNHLHAVVLDWPGGLASLPLKQEWEQTRLVVYARGLGLFRDLFSRLEILRGLGLQVFLPLAPIESLTALRILASVGVSCGVRFGDSPPPWQELNDLLHYAAYSPAPHAAIQPFQFVLREYDPRRITDYAAVYFDDPRRFLHVSADGRIALSRRDLGNGTFLAEGLESINKIPASPVYRERLTAWQALFREWHPCASCSAWRVCGGKFSATRKDDGECVTFFKALLAAAEYARSHNEREKRAPWPL